MGFRNPFRLSGRRERRRVHHRLLAGRAGPAAQPRAGRRWPGRDRPASRQLRLSGLLLEQARLLPVELPGVPGGHHDGGHPAGHTGAADRLWRRPRSSTTRDGCATAVPALSRAWPRRRPSPIRRSGTPTRQQPDDPARARRASAYYATTPGPIAPGSTTECPRLFPELFTGGVGPQGIAKYHYEPNNPSPTKFPPYYDDSVIFGEFTQDTMREVKLDSQNRVFKINSFLPCGQANIANPAFAVRVRQPDGHAVGRRRLALPVDLRRRVLRGQPGRRPVQVQLRQGPARAGRRFSTPTGPTGRRRSRSTSRASAPTRPSRASRSPTAGTSATAPRRSIRTRRTPTPPRAGTRWC